MSIGPGCNGDGKPRANLRTATPAAPTFLLVFASKRPEGPGKIYERLNDGTADATGTVALDLQATMYLIIVQSHSDVSLQLMGERPGWSSRPRPGFFPGRACPGEKDAMRHRRDPTFQLLQFSHPSARPGLSSES